MKFADANNRLSYIVLVAIPVAWILAVSIAEVMRDRIYPLDSAQIAANGALFQSLFFELRAFLTSPMDWLWDYFDQYPAVSLRRHPPLFGFVSGVVYSAFGVSTMAAKWTVLSFSVLLTAGVFAVGSRLLRSYLLASCATLLLVATPQVADHFRSVWLDVPSLSLSIWVFYFYLKRLDGDLSGKPVAGMVTFTVLALYMYQPVVILLTGVVVHMLIMEWRTFYKDRQILLGAVSLIVLMLPLVVFTLYFAMDSLQATTGVVPGEWKEFDSPGYADWMPRDKLTFAYWTEYAKIIAVCYPVQVFGVALWSLLRIWRKPDTGEVLMFVCTVVAYIAFSWLVVKGYRYTLYIMLPSSFLTVAALRDVSQPLLRNSAYSVVLATSLASVAAILQSIFAPLYAEYMKVEGFNEPVQAILTESVNAEVLYSGRADAAFVFYMRSYDTSRSSTVYRASMQLESPDEIAAFVESEGIDYILVETENSGFDSLEVIDKFREEIVSFAESSAAFEQHSSYRLPYGGARQEGRIRLELYKRR